MNWAFLQIVAGVAMVAAAGCKDARAPILSLPDAPTTQLAPPARSSWPAVPPGFLRIARLGIDLRSPPDAFAYTSSNTARVEWDGPRGECELEITAAPGARPSERKVVGTLPVVCAVHGRECGPWCDDLRPIHGGPAEEPYPTETPVIEIESAWGDRSQDQAGLFVWLNGTVQFYGAECSGFRGRRGNLPAARIAALLEALEHGGLLEHQAAHRREGAARDPECEHQTTWLTIRSTTRKNAISADCEPDALTHQAISLVDRVVGRNPCLGE